MTGIKNTLQYLIIHPRKIFLLDAAGAFLSFGFLFFGLRNFNMLFKMPAVMLILLSFAALMLFAFSILCFIINPVNRKVFLQSIIAGNLIYCLFTIGIVLRNLIALTVYDFTYFILECVIIVTLVWLELRVLDKV